MKANLENRIDLSVVVPVYNVKDTLYRAVESIISQSVKKLK